jgi:hypothetical protein
MRAPRRLWRELGAKRFLGLQVLMGGLILSALVHPWFYALLALDIWHGRLLGVPGSALGLSLLWIGIFNLIAGYVSAIALGSVAAARRGRLGLAAQALLMPAYWLAISCAAYRALGELASAPYYWEKTEHFARLAFTEGNEKGFEPCRQGPKPSSRQRPLRLQQSAVRSR